MIKVEPKWNGKRVRALRGKYMLTQEALHRVIGTTRQQTISEWEVEKFQPSRLYQPILEAASKRLAALWLATGGDINKFHRILGEQHNFKSEPQALKRRKGDK